MRSCGASGTTVPSHQLKAMGTLNRRAIFKGALAAGLWAGAGPITGACVWAQGTAAGNPIRARLSLNENPFGPSPRAIEAIRRELARLARYNDQARTNELIDTIAQHEGVDREHVVLGEILEPLGTHLALQGGPGGEFIYSVPGYTALVDAASTVGARTTAVPLDAELGNDLPAIASRIGPDTRAVFLVNPHNPSGVVSDTDAFKAFLRDVSQRTLAIVDEAYLEYVDDFAARTAVDLVRAGANVAVFRTFAKIYGLAGLDIGYGLLPKPLAASLRSRGVGAPRSLNRLAVVAAVASLRDTRFVSEVRRKTSAEREIWHQLLHRLGVRRARSVANFVFFDTGRPHAEISTALARQGIEIARAFAPYDTWVRISIGLPEENTLARRAITRWLER
jgi:histidinol-phosphate aminotransferase